MAYTFEFLPYTAGGVKRKADFSFYEVRWNSYGKFGHFEFQNNLESNISYKRELELGNVRKVFIEDFTLRTASGDWPYKYQELSKKFSGEVLNQLPEGIVLIPSTFLCARLRLQFSYEERQVISNQLNFSFRDLQDRDILFDDTLDISSILADIPIYSK